ncbi:thioredoxin-dependent thiol peroxidase [Lyngbya sp. CCY1209]|jgi:peroxiredoxin Q/BCP|uniref:thioredoxin-dependent thiol peroxidase n=1 Tax=Lyngbya sp. CCY1209 TaxID=2886103 RepID=UPI002D200B25|nr:thioredoxin-dependent thiol peroxidase [Lyngbya sp. CCY1209]MEB3885526.1 thioredoxin-dependent thiol peroxidase [Lyngbya sp. CCY1209]
MALNVGDRAPDFTLPDAEGNPVQLGQFRGKTVVLYFYPRDNTPGCTKEACGFRDRHEDYQNRDIIVLGVSADDAKSHRKFVAKYDLPFPLLCDEDGKIAALYDSYGLKKFMGREFMGIYRKTFVIDGDGFIQKIYPKVKTDTHATTILEDLSAT